MYAISNFIAVGHELDFNTIRHQLSGAEIVEILKASPQITSLRFPTVNKWILVDDDITALLKSNIFQQLSLLKHVDLTNSLHYLSPKTLLSLLDILPPTIESLDCGSNRDVFSDRGVAKIAEKLNKLKSLREIDLSRNFTERNIADIQKLLNILPPKMESLNLARNNLYSLLRNEDTRTEIAYKLANIKYLDLSGNQERMNADSIEILLEIVPPTIKSLTLTCVPDRMQKLANKLPGFKSLEILDIYIDTEMSSQHLSLNNWVPLFIALPLNIKYLNLSYYALTAGCDSYARGIMIRELQKRKSLLINMQNVFRGDERLLFKSVHLTELLQLQTPMMKIIKDRIVAEYSIFLTCKYFYEKQPCSTAAIKHQIAWRLIIPFLLPSSEKIKQCKQIMTEMSLTLIKQPIKPSPSSGTISTNIITRRTTRSFY